MSLCGWPGESLVKQENKKTDWGRIRNKGTLKCEKMWLKIASIVRGCQEGHNNGFSALGALVLYAM